MPPKKRGGAARVATPAKGKGPAVKESPVKEPVAEPEKVVPVEEPMDATISTPVQEPPAPAKAEANGKEEEEEEEEEEKEDAEKTAVDDEDAKEEEKSLIVKLRGFPKMPYNEMHLMLYDVFTNELKISLPQVKLPKGKEKWIYAECETLEDKKKVLETLNATYKYKNDKSEYPLQATSGWVASEHKEAEVLDKETALDTLFKYRKLSYKEQLNTKNDETQKMIKEIFENLKKGFPKAARNFSKAPEVGRIVPMVPTYGYSLDCSFSIEIDPETKETVVGLRATNKNAERIIPIDECPSIPKNMADAVKDFVSHLSEYGMEPFDREAETGNIVGVQCKMSTACEIILSVLVPKENTFLKEFIPIKTPEEVAKIKEESKLREEEKRKGDEAKIIEALKDKEEAKEEPKVGTEEVKNEGKAEEAEKTDEAAKPAGEKADESVTLVELDDEDVKATDEEKAKYGRQLKEIKPGLIKYFLERGKALGVVSIYSNWILCSRRGAWANRQHFYHHVCGATTVKEQTLNLQYDLWPYKQWSPRTSIFGTIINTIDSLVHLDKTTSIAVASEYRLVALYFAKRCKDVLSINFWSTIKKSTMQSRAGFSWWIQKQGIRNMEFVATKASALVTLDRTNFARSQGPKVAIVWGFSKVTLLRKLQNMGVRQIVTIFNVNRNVQNVQADIQKYFEAVAPSMVTSKVVPVDIQPHGNQYTLVCYLEEVGNFHGGAGVKRKGMEQMPAGGKRRRPQIPSLLNDGPKKAWEPQRPMVQNTMDPINSTISQLTGFMQSQLLFNEMMKAGIQEIMPHREQPRAPSPPRFQARPSWGGGRAGRDEGFGDFQRNSGGFNGRENANRWPNKRDDEPAFSRNRNVKKEPAWGGAQGGSGGGFNPNPSPNKGWLGGSDIKPPTFNRNDLRNALNFGRHDPIRRPRGSGGPSNPPPRESWD